MQHYQTKTYQKEHSNGLLSYLKDSLVDIYSSRYLAKQLAIRDIKAQYRQSYFGIIWAFITPLTTAFVWVFLSHTGTIKLTDTGVPYSLFAFVGTLIWSIIKEAINAPISNTNAAKGIISKINFPKEALIVSGIYKLLFNSAIKFVMLFGFLFFYEVGFHSSLIWLPIVLLGILMFGTAIGLLITPIGMLYKDVSKVINLGLTFIMYITPVVYVIPKDAGLMKTLMELNPLTAIIVTAKDVAFGTEPVYLTYFMILMACSLPVFCLGLLFYRISIPIIVERLSA